MPLDHANGEYIDGLGVGKIVNPDKWSDTAFFDLACDHAAAAFSKAGAIHPVDFDNAEIMVMEYPVQSRLAFVFCKHIAGSEKLFPFIFKLDPPVVNELVNTGRWERPN